MAGKYNPEIHKRRSIRLKGYDYAQMGAYFVMICTQHRECLFGDIRNSEIDLNPYGLIVSKCWNELTDHYKHIEMGKHIIMPNHIHAIINITVTANVGAGLKRAGLKPAPTDKIQF